MNTIPTKAENPKGFHRKYIILKADSNKRVSRDAEYFILRLDAAGKDRIHVNACRKAVLLYAEEIKNHLPKLAADLIKRYSEQLPESDKFIEV